MVSMRRPNGLDAKHPVRFVWCKCIHLKQRIPRFWLISQRKKIDTQIQLVVLVVMLFNERRQPLL